MRKIIYLIVLIILLGSPKDFGGIAKSRGDTLNQGNNRLNKFQSAYNNLIKNYQFSKAVKLCKDSLKENKSEVWQKEVATYLDEAQRQYKVFKELIKRLNSSDEGIKLDLGAMKIWIDKADETCLEGPLVSQPSSSYTKHWVDLKPEVVYGLFEEVLAIVKLEDETPFNLAIFCYDHNLISQADALLSYYYKRHPKKKDIIDRLISRKKNVPIPKGGFTIDREKRVTKGELKKEKGKEGRKIRKITHYAIVVSNATNQDSQWAKVVEKLKEKYNGKVFCYQGSIQDVKGELSKFHPRYVCFVAKYNEVSKGFVQNAIRYMTSLDSDPYEDAVWAILTGRDVNDAMRIASAKPLTVKFGLLHTAGGWLGWFKEGLFFSECEPRGKGTVKKPGQKPEQVKVPGDTAKPFVQAVNKNKVHFIVTSGHGTEKNWQMGYPSWGGRVMIAGGGNLVAKENLGRGKAYPINTTNPKIYYSPGNCLVAHINKRDCYCLSWIHNGCNHFYGHVINQSRYCAAWSIGGLYFCGLQDQFTFAEACYIARQAARLTRPKGGTRCLNGTVLYGDPGWDARMARSIKPAYDQKLTVKPIGENKYEITFTIKTNRGINFSPRYGGAACAFLPGRATKWSNISSDADKIEITDNLVMMQINGKVQKGDTKQCTFTVEGEGFENK